MNADQRQSEKFAFQCLTPPPQNGGGNILVTGTRSLFWRLAGWVSNGYDWRRIPCGLQLLVQFIVTSHYVE